MRKRVWVGIVTVSTLGAVAVGWHLPRKQAGAPAIPLGHVIAEKESWELVYMVASNLKGSLFNNGYSVSETFDDFASAEKAMQRARADLGERFLSYQIKMVPRFVLEHCDIDPETARRME